MKLPNYLYNYILECIVNYKYNNINNTFISNYINSKDYHYGINIEIINYSLVNKKYFELVSNLLFKYYSLEKNNELLYYLMPNQYNNNDNNKYKLLKFKPITVYNSFDMFIDNQHQINNNLKNIININEDDIDEFKEIINKQFNNCEFNISFSIDQYKGDLIYLIKEFKNQYNNILDLELNGTECEKEQDGNDGIFNKIMKLKPRSIRYQPNDDYCQESYIHMNYTPMFINNDIEHIYISNSDHVDPFSISKINNNHTKLKSLSCSMLFHDIIKGLNNEMESPQHQTSNINNLKTIENECDCDYGGLIIERSISHDWLCMIDTLKCNNTLKELSLKNFCYRGNCINELDTTRLTNSLKELFTSPISQIETLELQTIDFIDHILLNGLQLNKTIKNLILMNTNESLIFKYVLSNGNNTIRNIYLNCINSIEQLLNLLNESLNINLYSITIKFKQYNQQIDLQYFKDQYSIISKLNNITINEFNFYSCNNRKFKTIFYN